MRNEFDNQLKQLNRQLITMGSLCEEAIALSAKALQGMPDHPEQQVPALEREIDQLEREIESSCMNLLLRQQPVAQDLRTISAEMCIRDRPFPLPCNGKRCRAALDLTLESTFY